MEYRFKTLVSLGFALAASLGKCHIVTLTVCGQAEDSTA
ncbi:hypothetical protein R2A130_0045 [Ahrensia sp. R2A130]|nr:hypothetical protein R2A130_0045 [Ahrensia sp. R2A130]